MPGAAKLFLVCKHELCTHQNVFLPGLIFDPPVLDVGSGRGLKVALRREEKGRNVPCVGDWGIHRQMHELAGCKRDSILLKDAMATSSF